uniref:Uncharacterized protein n=2 Tax=Trichogramma kaykai TaxID=54128 RepID=A0ABD2X318_9HYME
MTFFNQFEKVKILRDNFRTWELESDRRDFLRQLCPLIKNWRTPDILNIFDREEIECLLADSVKYLASDTGDDRDELFINFLIRCDYRDEPNVNNDHRTTALHHLARSSPQETRHDNYFYLERMCLSLFQIYVSLGVNYIDDESGYTHFHIACRFGCKDVVWQFLERGQDPNILQQKTGDRPLHMAVKYRRMQVMELLLEAGADPNQVDIHGQTALHVIAKKNDGDYAESLFKLSWDRYRPLELNARDTLGNTPLHYALKFYRGELSKLLLVNGADPNVDNNYKKTPLHILSSSYHGCHFKEEFFSICDNMSLTLRTDVEDQWGDTPLLLALRNRSKKMVDLLIRRRADPNLVTLRWSTALHMICESDEHDQSAKWLFEICDKRNRTIQVEARDKAGNTLLQLAVTNVLPNTVEALLKHGADITNCVFPSFINPKALMYHKEFGFKMRVACGALAVAEHLQSNGYNFSRSDALSIMNFFHIHGLFKKSSTKVEESWYDDDDKEFASKAKEIMITSSTSLYDVLKLRPEEEDKLLTYADYSEFAFYRSLKIPGPHYRTCILHLCEKMSGGFFRRWALHDFWELIHKKLPLECCEKVLDNLTNEDLYHIVLAVDGKQSS